MKKELESYFSKRENEDKKTKSLLSFLTQTLDKVKTGSKEAIQEARTWLTDHAESTKAYLSQNGSKFAQKTLKTLGALVICTALVIGSTGCNNLLGGNTNTSQGVVQQDPNYSGPTSFPELENRPIEDIMNEGIKAEDVLAYYDDLMTKLARAIYGSAPNKDRYNVDETKLNAQFSSITPSLFLGEPIEYYYNSLRTPLQHHWFDDPNGQYYMENPGKMENTYNVCINGYMEYEGRYGDLQYENLSISKKAMERMFNAYNIKPFNMTSEFADSSKHQFLSLSLVGSEVYDGFTIDRDLISNSNEEQLWSIYNMLDSIEKINFLGINPDEIEYEME